MSRILLSGTVETTVTKPFGRELPLRLQDGTIVTLLIGAPISVAIATRADKVGLNDLRPGDRITASTHPDPQRALVYATTSILDKDLRSFTGSQGVVIGMDGARHLATVRFGATALLVDLSPHVRVSLPGGETGTEASMQPGDAVDITGVLNTRVNEVVLTRTITITQRA